MHDLIVAILSFFLLDPLQAEIAERLASAEVPLGAAAAVQTCATNALPVIIDRATSDPWWAITSVAGVWSGYADPAAILVEAAPTCAPAVDAALGNAGPSEV